MPLDQLSAILACAILAGLAVFQGLFIGGAPLGRMAWRGQHIILPGRLRIVMTRAALVLAALYFVLALN